MYDNDLADTFNEPIFRNLPQLPNKIKIVFSMHKIDSVKDINLDISEKRLKLTSGEIYNFNVVLSYPVLQEKATAKFDKVTKILTVVIDVDKTKVINQFKELERINELKQKDIPEIVR